MDLYDKLIGNPLFFKWIFHSSPEINSYWDHYLELNPKEAKYIRELKSKIEIHLKYNDKKLTEFEKKSLAKRIISQLEKSDISKNRRRFAGNLMRYAATALLFFTIGGSLVYLFMEKRQSGIACESNAMPVQLHDPVLFIGGDKQIALNRGESELEYSEEGEITLNNEQTIKKDPEYKNEPPEMNTLVIPYGNRSVITLSDGSRVWINAGSRLIYPSRFVDKTREVFLSGEAFFNIEKNEDHPFIVKTTDVKVEVTGTRFNVSAYPEDYSVQTVLAEGSVEIKKSKGGIFEKAVQLSPGELGYFNKKTYDTRIYKVDVEHYTSWTEGLFSFINTDLSRIVKRLERYYNVRIQFDDPFKGSIQITGKMDVTKGRDQVFEYLSKLTGLEFIKINNSNYIMK
jgi:transmembrane sensor